MYVYHSQHLCNPWSLPSNEGSEGRGINNISYVGVTERAPSGWHSSACTRSRVWSLKPLSPLAQHLKASFLQALAKSSAGPLNTTGEAQFQAARNILKEKAVPWTPLPSPSFGSSGLCMTFTYFKWVVTFFPNRREKFLASALDVLHEYALIHNFV